MGLSYRGVACWRPQLVMQKKPLGQEAKPTAEIKEAWQLCCRLHSPCKRHSTTLSQEQELCAIPLYADHPGECLASSWLSTHLLTRERPDEEGTVGLLGVDRRGLQWNKSLATTDCRCRSIGNVSFDRTCEPVRICYFSASGRRGSVNVVVRVSV